MKKFMLITMSGSCLEKRGIFLKVSPPCMTIEKRITDITAKLTEQLKLRTREHYFCSLVMDENVQTAKIQLSCFFYSRSE